MLFSPKRAAVLSLLGVANGPIAVRWRYAFDECADQTARMSGLQISAGVGAYYAVCFEALSRSPLSVN
jgi:hypothetical protein